MCAHFFERSRYEPDFSTLYPSCNPTACVWCRNTFEDEDSVAKNTLFYQNSSESRWDLQACHLSNSIIYVSSNGLRMKTSAQQSTVKVPLFKSQQRKTINLKFLLPPPNQLHKMAKLLWGTSLVGEPLILTSRQVYITNCLTISFIIALTV